MAPAAIGTLAVTGLLVAGLAIYLIMIATSLQKISATLSTVYGAVDGIANQVKPAPGVVGSIADDVGAIQGALHGLIALATSQPPAAPAPPAPSRRAAPAAAGTSSGGARPNLPPPVHRRH